MPALQNFAMRKKLRKIWRFKFNNKCTLLHSLLQNKKNEKIAISLFAFGKTGKERIAPSRQQEVGRAVVFGVHAVRKLISANY